MWQTKMVLILRSLRSRRLEGRTLAPRPMFAFPDDAAWNETEDAVEFGLELGAYRGRVFVSRRLIQTRIGHRPTPEECVAYYHQARTELERVAEARVRARDLDDDANIRITGRDLRRLAP